MEVYINYCNIGSKKTAGVVFFFGFVELHFVVYLFFVHFQTDDDLSKYIREFNNLRRNAVGKTLDKTMSSLQVLYQ